MTESDARAWIVSRFGDHKAALLERFGEIVGEENERQNLVSKATLDSIWTRHLVDSAQLVPLAPECGTWLDIGTGGGFPGMIVAALREQPVVLCEPRRQRAQFLKTSAGLLGLSNVSVEQRKVAALSGFTPAIISARAVAPVDVLFRDTLHLTHPDTLFVFPRGRSGTDELSAAKRNWRGMFHVKQSITDADSVIVTATKVRPS
ncbi:Ribosomal RNA small subunit methyltransferase G [Sphingomonas sp. EC-HK361]|uniref:16S rRNA (guanine(527)-N(7))-methyltransferase RsmG n=1 Tax=Sphingomonas sp. EC-HK361 TaxID=2038397 RepID=UPI00125ABE69|nr:16S rRNA (guanine(527)-N(7))-methyltransferase RsmG [Sphingomonas sp. EC-HK361]VVS97753.1 Ribosomal RNA small subunit methyltransferase G [Sphingomonas sp. EC-HK361]